MGKRKRKKKKSLLDIQVNVNKQDSFNLFNIKSNTFADSRDKLDKRYKQDKQKGSRAYLDED